MFNDETCRFVAIDFDDGDFKNDILEVAKVCDEKGISYAIERSRSGEGAHLWIFFSENVSAYIGRKLGSSLLTNAMNKRYQINFSSYDRLFPNQDTMPKGGFGNLIALPLQKKAREYGNSEFVNEKFISYKDQWSFLSSIKKHSKFEVERFIELLVDGNELGNLHQDAEEEKPWEKKQEIIEIQRDDFPEVINIVRANMLYIDKTNISTKLLNHLKRLAAFRNPEFYKAQAMRLPIFQKPRIISCSEETEKYLCLPRGLEDEIKSLANSFNVKMKWQDKVYSGKKIKVEFNGNLRDEQEEALKALIKHNNGILSATTAFGKTVIGASLIASKKVNTLILVHRTSLLTQWKERLEQFLTIDETIPEDSTKKRGSKKNNSIIGELGGGKNRVNGVIDIAVMQSLLKDGEVKELVKNYGMVIVDECHHVSAFSFEKILKTTNAKYVYGLTATPTRQDGHHPIIYMQCGKIRHRVDAKKQAEERPFEHYVITRFTNYKRPNLDDEDINIAQLYNDIGNDELRNEQIISDVIKSIENGRNPIILTERTEHVKYLVDRLSKKFNNVIGLTGGLTPKKNREIREKVTSIPADENFILVATGKFVGEGFDMPRLDTLFLVMPISWKGTLQQYAGRLHRLYEGKSEVIVYDYVDINIKVLEKMYHKRLKGYALIGYKAKADDNPLSKANIIFDNNNFLLTFTNDVLGANQEVLIVSPYLTQRRINMMIKYFNNSKADIIVVTRPESDYKEREKKNINKCIELLKANNIKVKFKNKIHQKFAIIDKKIVWYGSINLLSFGNSEESIMRIENLEIANELGGILQ